MVQHLAELNIGRVRYPLDDARMAGFVDNLDLVNGLAERGEGFVWRLKDDSGDATSIPSASGASLRHNWFRAPAARKNTTPQKTMNPQANLRERSPAGRCRRRRIISCSRCTRR